MEAFETILLAGGHRNSLGRSQEVYDIVTSDPGKLDELFSCVYADDAWVRMRAIDTFEKLVRDNPKLAQPYTNKLVEDLTKKDQPSIQWHLAQLFTEIELDAPQLEGALSWLKEKLSTTEVDWIVSANAMKALVYFYNKKLVNLTELTPLLRLQTEHKSKSVRKKAQQFLDAVQAPTRYESLCPHSKCD